MLRAEKRVGIEAIACLLACAWAGCGPAPFRPAEAPLFAGAAFPLGVGVDNRYRFSDGSRFGALAWHHFGRITPGNALKMDALRPDEQTFDFAEADRFVALCEKKGKPVWGHTLVWHLQTPAWLGSFGGDPAAWRALMDEHIAEVAGRYRGRVVAWDVVNEAFEDDGRLRDSPWRTHLGDDYLAAAFTAARSADPDALLFYNDYGIPFHPAKLQAVLDLVDDFQARDPPVPIDGVGFQMHVTGDDPPVEAIRQAQQALAARGLMIHFSELDVSMNLDGTASAFTPALAEAQRARYRAIVAVYRELPASLQAGITVWGVGDGDSWIRYFFGRQDWPLLFDDDYEPKPAFFGVEEALAD